MDFVLQHQPKIVILELGANDALRGLPLFQIEQNLAIMIEQLQKTEVTVVLAGMKIPPNYGKPYSNGFEQIYPKLAEQYQLALIPFFLSGVAGNLLLTLPDGLHPTAKGYELIAEQVYPILKPLLKK
jgi:acyl-CoA thioesterase-1